MISIRNDYNSSIWGCQYLSKLSNLFLGEETGGPGRREAFDRSWTLGNVVLMGIYAAMFSFDFWAGYILTASPTPLLHTADRTTC
jgi:hypothetical protein